jgi:amino acid transporter
VAIVTLLLCARIRMLGVLAVILCAGTLITMLAVIGAGATHFNAALLRFPPGAFHLNWTWAVGLGGAMQLAVYDYFGYYNICYLGDEVKQPARTIPRAIIWSVIIIAILYLTMNICILAVVPWQEAKTSQNIAATFMEHLYGRRIAVFFTALIIWTAFASCFAMTLGYSRIPYAAAKEGDFFRIFSRLQPTGKYPWVSLLAVSGLTAIFCYFPLQTVIDGAVTVRILIQFVGQIIALHLLRVTRPDVKLPFRMWMYPLPSAIALIGWVFMYATSAKLPLIAGAAVILVGLAVYPLWRLLLRYTCASR